MMISRQQLIPCLLIIVMVSLFLAGCTRPAPEGDATAVAAEPDLSDPNVGGGTGLDPTQAPPTTMPPEVEATPTEEVVGEEEVVVAETAVSTATPESTSEETETTSVEQPIEETSPTNETAASIAECPTDHVVQPDENLFRIGLQYGLSWVTIAQYNGINNPNNITVGQIIKIPCKDGTTPPPVQPTLPPDDVATYTVQPGDNLFRIGLKFGVSWVEIAEANGIVNPNEIYTGQVLKIPTSAPGPRPEFTHVVKPGETIYSISVQYGVSATVIAEVNNLQSPYVIYAGQTLIIPGNG